jgi:hypothetical protein
MDAETNPNHLNAEFVALRRVLATLTPPYSTLATELHDVRMLRAKVAERYAAACAVHHYLTPERGPSAEMIALESQVANFDKQIGTLRERLAVARNEWRPKYAKAVKAHLDSANAALAHAADLVDGAARVHCEADRYAMANGVGDNHPKSKRLEDVANLLRRFCGPAQ